MSHFSNPEQVRLDPTLAALTAGSRVGGGRFMLIRLLGQGGMGVVWLARDEHLRDGVALKFLPPEIRHDAAALDDLRRETSRSRKLTHPHIIRIHDLYKLEHEAFISMEYVDGPNLSELRLQQPTRVLKWSFLEPLMRELCAALQYAHGEHIIHRDLKPANMMLDGRGRLKLADFGIAAMISDSMSRVSMGQYKLSGTASYMSPQQLDGQPPQVTDDIYSLGSTLYELLSGRAPFFTGDIAHQVRSFPAQPLEKRLEQLHVDNPVAPAVSATIMACLSKDPAKRPQSAQAVAEQIGLEPLSARSSTEPIAATSQLSTSLRAASPGTAELARQPATRRESGSTPEKSPDAFVMPRPAEAVNGSARGSEVAGGRRAIFVLTALATSVAIAGGAWWWSQRRASNGTPQTPLTPVPEFVELLNGHDVSGWDGDPQVWSIKEGVITATGGTSKERRPVALFWRGGLVDDFELRLSFRIKSGNSGIYYRARQLLGYEVGGYQFEISGNQTGNLIETGSDRLRREPSRRGFVTSAQVVDGKEKVTVEGPGASSASELQQAFQPTNWNDVVILVQSNHIIHKLNGYTIVDSTDRYEKRPGSGTIAFEVYGSVPTAVQFKDIRLKRLTPFLPAGAKER